MLVAEDTIAEENLSLKPCWRRSHTGVSLRRKWEIATSVTLGSSHLLWEKCSVKQWGMNFHLLYLYSTLLSNRDPDQLKVLSPMNRNRNRKSCSIPLPLLADIPPSS
ncbi:UNVERIFIED_CONTAM: hypothetical protein K2H54_019495 [Gekko kuhli]